MVLVVVKEMDEGDGLAAVRGPLVEAARRVLLGGAAGDEVALEELDLEVNKQLKVNKPAGLEELEGDCEGGGEVGDLLCGDVLHRLLVLPDVLVGRLHQLSLAILRGEAGHQWRWVL